MLHRAIEDELYTIFKQGKYFDHLGGRIKSVEKHKLETLTWQKSHFAQQLGEIRERINQTFNIDAQIKEGEAVVLIKERLEILAKERDAMSKKLAEVEKRLTHLAETPASVPTADASLMAAFRRGWKKATGMQKRRLLQGVIEKIYPTEEGLIVYYNVCSGRKPTTTLGRT
jgi:hypothetical protein